MLLHLTCGLLRIDVFACRLWLGWSWSSGGQGRGGRHSILAELVEEARECLGGQEHSCQVGEAGILLNELTVLDAEIVCFLDLDGDFAFELTDVLCKNVSLGLLLR